MMKYDFDLDLSSKNSVSLIISKIKQGSIVLEFGPAAGRMTRYLKEELDCKVYIVEIDEEAAKKSSVYAEESIIGNIEEFVWYDKFKNVKFDHIIFADVLEHLYNPQLVLKKCVELLEENGTLLTSVPNIAHNSVIIDLLHNKFEYRKTGLLDDTHIRFFTYSSLVAMVQSSGLEVKWEDAIVKSVGHTEFNNYFDELPKAVTKYLKKRPLGDIYQYVLELKLQSAYPESSNKKSNIVSNGDYYYTQLYVNCGDGFSESQSIRIKTVNNNEVYLFDTSGFENINSIRIDPLNTNCLIKLRCISYTDINNEEHIVTDFSSNADYITNDIYFFDHDDPQIVFNTVNSELQEVRIQLNIIDYETESANWFREILAERNARSEGQLAVLENEKSDLLLKNSESTKKIQNIEEEFMLKEQKLLNEIDALKVDFHRLEDEIQSKNMELESKQEQLDSVNGQLDSVNRQLDSANEHFKHINSKLSEIYASRFWKVYSRLFKKK